MIIRLISNNYIHSVPRAPIPSNRVSKLEELKMLLAKYFRPHDATKLLTVVVGQMAVDRNEDFLDATLEQLRDRDRYT